MSNEKKTSFATACVPGNLSRYNYFSDTYTAIMTVNGHKRPMDITHISLPFAPSREKAVMNYFGFDKEQMQELYQSLARSITNQVNTSSYLNSKGVPSILRIVKSEIVQKATKGTDIYLVTEHYRTLDHVYFGDGRTTLKEIFNFGARMAKIIKDINQAGEQGVIVRVLDYEQIFVAADGKYVFGSLQYAYNRKNGGTPVPIAKTAPMHIDSTVATGSQGNLGTDMYSLASILWSLLNGDGFERVTATGVSPKHATPEMVRAIELGFTADAEMFPQFRKALNDVNRALAKDQSGLGDQAIPVPYPDKCITKEIVENDYGTVVTVKATEEIAAAAAAAVSAANAEAIEPDREEVAPPVEPQEKVEGETGKGEAAEVIDTVPPVTGTVSPVPPVPFEEEPYTQDDTVSVLDYSAYVEEKAAEFEVSPDSPKEGMEFVVLYSKPSFFIHDALVFLGVAAVIATLVYISISQHLFSFW